MERTRYCMRLRCGCSSSLKAFLSPSGIGASVLLSRFKEWSKFSGTVYPNENDASGRLKVAVFAARRAATRCFVIAKPAQALPESHSDAHRGQLRVRPVGDKHSAGMRETLSRSVPSTMPRPRSRTQADDAKRKRCGSGNRAQELGCSGLHLSKANRPNR